MSEKEKHTPGPWVWGEDFSGLGSANGEVLTYLDYEGMWLSYGINRQANARLIAAAPELLEALEHIMRCIPPGGFAQIHYESSTWAQIQAAIAKALGEKHDS